MLFPMNRINFFIVCLVLIYTSIKGYSQEINFIENNTVYEQYFLVGKLGHNSSNVRETLKISILRRRSNINIVRTTSNGE